MSKPQPKFSASKLMRILRIHFPQYTIMLRQLESDDQHTTISVLEIRLTVFVMGDNILINPPAWTAIQVHSYAEFKREIKRLKYKIKPRVAIRPEPDTTHLEGALMVVRSVGIVAVFVLIYLIVGGS